MMIYKVSLLRGTKIKPKLEEVAMVEADGYQIAYGCLGFYTIESRLFGKDKITRVTEFPCTYLFDPWIVTTV